MCFKECFTPLLTTLKAHGMQIRSSNFCSLLIIEILTINYKNDTHRPISDTKYQGVILAGQLTNAAEVRN